MPKARTSAGAALSAAALLWAGAVTPASPAAATQACNVDVNVNDPHPGDTNVRAAPGGKVIAALQAPANDDWIEAHVVGQAGDWFLVDRAWQVHVSGEPSERTVLFRGRGYMHKSVLGVNGLAGGAAVHAAPDPGARRLRVPFIEKGDETLDYHDLGGDLIGCKGEWLHLRIRDFTGWTREACLNGVTTCV
jgi:hypothetical protein